VSARPRPSQTAWTIPVGIVRSGKESSQNAAGFRVLSSRATKGESVELRIKESRLSAVSFERNQHPNNNRKRKDSYNARRYERTNNGFSVRESRVSPTHQLF
jgi:hypothetical protein